MDPSPAEVAAPHHVLLVEDDIRFAELLQEWLQDANNTSPFNGAGFRLTHTETLTQALAQLQQAPFAVLLVDLNLPDSRGFDTFLQLATAAAAHPIIVLSGLDDETMAIQAVRHGAQDYLVKDAIDGNLLLRSMHHALERHRLHQELERLRQAQRQAREQDSLARLAGRENSPVAARMLGVQSLKKGYPDVFSGLTTRVGHLLDKLLQMRTHKVSFDVSAEMKSIAAELGFLKCGPRDVVDLYLTVLEAHATPLNQARNEAIHEESRYLAFELMGHLVALYRLHALGRSA